MIRVEIRANSVHIEGYVCATGRDSRPISSSHGKFIEQVEPKTFAKSLRRNPNVELRFNHRADKILGSTETGELQLREDNIGLFASCDVTDPDVIEKANKGELRGWSFGFYNRSDEWKDADDGMQRRYLKDIDMSEVSILSVTPAYIATSIEQRSDSETAFEKRGYEDETQIVKQPENNEEQDENEEEKRALISRYKHEVEFLKMKGGQYNEK